MKSYIAVLVFLAALPAGSAQELAEISGKVIDSSTKQPLAGARVVLFRWDEGTTFMYDTVTKAEPVSQPQDPKSGMFVMLTGDDGRFSFSTTAPSNFNVYARCKGYVGWGEDIATSKFLSVQPGQKRGDITIAMDLPGSITGRVIDPETEKPLAGLSVTPMAWRVMNGSRALTFAAEGTTTDKNGAYEIKNLRPGEYVLQATSAYSEKFVAAGTQVEFQNSDQLAYLRSYYPGVERREQAASVTLLPGVALDRIDFKLSKRRAAALRGCIRSDVNTDQLGDVALGLMITEVQGTTTSFSALANKTVRADACFRIDGLSPGKHVLSAESKGANPAEVRRAFAFFDLDDRKIDDIELNLMKGIAIHGRVSLHETVTEPAAKDKPLGVFLDAQGRAGYADENSTAEVSASDGSFVLPSVFQGSYKVRVHQLPKGLGVGEVIYNGARAKRGVITLNPGAPDQKLEVVLYPATASISLTVEGGSKAADAQLVLLPEDPDPQDPQLDARATKADSEGRGSFAGLLAGKYRVFAFVPDAAWRTDPSFAQQLIAGKDVEVSKDSAQNIEVKLSRLQ